MLERGNAGAEKIMIDVKTENEIAVVTLKHGKANALDIEFCDALAKCFEELRASAARAVVVTGQGGIFSAGVDLIRANAGGADYMRKFLPVLNRSFESIFFHPKPLVAAINGHAMAGGAVLACCADRRIMARSGGRIGVTELLVGVPFPALAFEAVRFAVPARYFPESLFSGATYEADIALQRGWVEEVVAADALMPRAIAAAQQLAQLSSVAFAETKRQLRQEIRERLDRSGAAADKLATEIWAAPETLRSIGDYVARTLKKA
jgi:enoyl-CoA hydratase